MGGKDRTNSRAKDQDEKFQQIMRRMMDILQAMMSGIADKEKTDLVFAIDQPASVPASEDEMAKQIIRQMMKSLQSQTSGTEDKDMIELVNGINQQMTNILKAQMAGALDQHTSPVIKMKEQKMRQTDELVNDDQEEEDKSQMKK